MALFRCMWVSWIALAAFAAAEDVHGTLIDGSGKPVAGAKLSFGFRGPRGAMKRVTATTDSSGAFVVGELDAARDLPLTGLTVDAGERLSKFTLKENGGSAAIEAGRCTAHVTLVDGSDKPISGVPLQLVALMAPTDASGRSWTNLAPIGEDSWNRLSKAVTGSDGAVAFQGLPAGMSISVAVRSNGLNLDPGSPIVLDRELVEVRLVGRRGCIVAGRVLRDGVGVPGISVSAASRFGNTLYPSRPAMTDAQGNYRIEDVRPGIVEVSADPGKSMSDFVASPLPPVSLTEGKERDGLDLNLIKAIPMRIKVVTREDEQPVGKAAVYVINGATWRKAGPTDASGEATVSVAPGEFEVMVDSVAGRQSPEHTPTSVSVDADNHPDVVLRVPKTLTLPIIEHFGGTVVDSKGAPVAGAKVSQIDPSVSATTDAQGRFSFDSPTVPGTFVVAEKGDATCSKIVEATDSAPVQIKLNAKKMALSGRVVFEDGTPAAGAKVELGSELNHGYGGGSQTKTDANGNWSLTGLYPSVKSFFIWFKKDGFSDETLQDIRPTGQDMALAQVKLIRRDGTIDGHLVDGKGNPVGGLMVSCQGRGDDAMADEKGAFHLKNVIRGKLVLTVGDGHRMWQAVDAQAGDKDLRITVGPPPEEMHAGTVAGDVTGSRVTSLAFGEWVQGSPVPLSAMKGKVTVLDLWATWCGPCREAMPHIEELYKKYASKGLLVVGVHIWDGKPAEVQAALKKLGVTYPNVLDTKGKSGYGSIFAQFGLKGIPNLVVIDREGRVALSTDEPADVEKKVAELLASK